MRQISSGIISVFSLLLLALAPPARAKDSSETLKMLPQTVGDFRLQSKKPAYGGMGNLYTEDAAIQGEVTGVYVSSKGERLTVFLASTRSHTGAYAYLTNGLAELRRAEQSPPTRFSDLGVAGFAVPGQIVFYKGPVYVSVAREGKTRGGDAERLLAFAHAFADTLPEAEKEIPVLVKHLPDWETAQDRAVYTIGLHDLQEAAGAQPILPVAVDVREGADAVTADYDGSRLVIIEYNTPQLAADADARITARLQELKAQGENLPSAYRRVGNYSVFVFGAPDEATATRLIDNVKWEQKIQWLGENPLLWASAKKQHTRQAVSLILGIAKTIGFFVGICLGAGALFGGVFYLRRKVQQRAAVENYTDAGGMLRLNIDEMTPETDPSKLLAAGDEKSVAR